MDNAPAVSQENVETVRRGYDAWNRGDLDAVREIYAPDVTANAGALWTAAGELAGSEAIIEAFASIRATFQNSELVPDEYIERGESRGGPHALARAPSPAART